MCNSERRTATDTHRVLALLADTRFDQSVDFGRIPVFGRLHQLLLQNTGSTVSTFVEPRKPKYRMLIMSKNEKVLIKIYQRLVAEWYL